MKAAAWISTLCLSIRLLISFSALDPPTSRAYQQSTQVQPKRPAAKQRPSPEEVADAKAKGLVWVNTATHVYHKEGPSYGATRHGKFLTEDDAKKAGYRIASEPGNKEGRKSYGRDKSAPTSERVGPPTKLTLPGRFPSLSRNTGL